MGAEGSVMTELVVSPCAFRTPVFSMLPAGWQTFALTGHVLW